MVWKTAEADEKLALVRDINRIEPVTRFSPDESRVEILPLPFYPGGTLVLAAKAGMKGTAAASAPLWYVRLPKEIVVLDGSVANIHHLNAAAPLLLNQQTIADYLKFRLYFCKQGWLEGVLATEHQGAFNATARILEKDGAFEATLTVSPRGEVNVLRREKISASGKPAPALFSFS
jgi:hypothetical protein